MLRYATIAPLLAALAACQPEDASRSAHDGGDAQSRGAATSTAAESPRARLAGLDAGWNMLEPGAETTCSDGSDYRFFVRPGDPAKLLVYFQGGGACWNGENCDPHIDPSYKRTVEDGEPERYDGIFDFEHPENPFRDYSVVFAPYCTGDVHLGDNVATYQAPATENHEAHEVTIRHRGIVNANAVLEWTYGHFLRPRRIFVTGSSAGAIPSPYYAWQIGETYPDARLAQLGDAAGGYRRSAESTYQRMQDWGTLDYLSRHSEFADMEPEAFTYESLYIAAAKRYPGVTFAQYDAAEDAVQKRFLAMAGNDTDTLQELLEQNQADIRAEVDNFRSYIAGGDSHTILARPEFYQLHVDGVRIRDWVARLAAYEPVDDIVCTDCARAQGVPEEQQDDAEDEDE